MARTKQTARKSTGGKAPKIQLAAQRKGERKTQADVVRTARSKADLSDRRERKTVTESERVSKSGKTKAYTVLFNGKTVTKIVPTPAPKSKTRLDVFTKEDLAVDVDKRQRAVRVVKLLDDERGALVEWMDGVEIWVSPTTLVGPGGDCEPWLECTRAFMQSEETELLKFVESHHWGKDYDGASADGLCGFHALRSAVAFLGMKVSKESVLEYVAEVKEGRGIDLADGTNYDELVRFATARGLPLDFQEMDKNKFASHGAGVRGVQRAMTEDGVYIVSGRVDQTIWHHVVAAWKCGDLILVLDEDSTKELKDLAWLTDITYVRKVQMAQ